jgi:hypothetical protein
LSYQSEILKTNQMFGNILFVITLIFFGFLANLLQKPMPGGDYGVGYSYAFLILGAGFVISTGLLAWNMNLNHCFDWLPASYLRYRNWLVLVGWIAFVTATFWGLEYHKAFILLHLLVFGSCFYLINAQKVAGFPPTWAKTSIQVGFLVSLLIALVIFGLFAKSWVQRRAGRFQGLMAWQTERKAEYQKALDDIQNYNDSTIVGLLKYVEKGNDKQLRNNAIAKIKSFEHWESDLIGVLTQKDLATRWAYNDDSRYVYAFLEDNSVEHREKFIEPIKYSLKVFAIRAENDLDDPYKRELWSLNLEAFCRVLEAQFKDYAKEFKPGMMKLQQVLAVEYPERKSEKHIKWYNKTVKAYRLAVKNWLDANP